MIDARLVRDAERVEGPILLNRDGDRRLDRHAATRIVKRLARRAGIDKSISPHSLRHSFITAALDAGVALRDVSQVLDDASLRDMAASSDVVSFLIAINSALTSPQAGAAVMLPPELRGDGTSKRHDRAHRTIYEMELWSETTQAFVEE